MLNTKRNALFLLQYFSLVLGVFALELSAGIALFAYRSQVGDTLAGELRAGLAAAGNMSDTDPVVITWHRLHTAFGVRDGGVGGWGARRGCVQRWCVMVVEYTIQFETYFITKAIIEI